MLCTFFVQIDGRMPRKIGPVRVKDNAEINRLAQVEFERNAEARAIDAWLGDGELFRLTRENTVTGDGALLPDAPALGQPRAG